MNSPTLKLYSSNSINKLKNKLIDEYKKHSEVFTTFKIISPTAGMNVWLTQQIANETIATNIKYNSAENFINEIFSIVNDNKNNFLSINLIKWELFHLLDDEDFKSKFDHISKYYKDEELKRLSLASKMANLFEQYQEYRSYNLSEWSKIDLNTHDWEKENKEEIEENKEEKEKEKKEFAWQKYLWLRLSENIKDKAFSKKDKVEIIIKGLKSHQNEIKKHFPKIHVFGLAIFTPIYHKIFVELSDIIDIHIYLLNPSPEVYWFDTESEKYKLKYPNREFIDVGNTLLVNCGKVIIDNFSKLFESGKSLDSYEELISEPQNNTLLNRIKSDIFNNKVYDISNTDKEDKISEELIKDKSLLITSNYTKIREVETLYNYLIDIYIKEKNNLNARDILVIIPNIDEYAPFIKTIFSNAPYKFPINISDRSILDEDNILSALNLVLSIDETTNFKVEDILRLIESPKIRSHFNINDIDKSRDIIKKANIRFGLKGDKENGTNIYSWETGFKRLLYGICISGEKEIEEDIYSADFIEGYETVEILKLFRFFNALTKNIEERKSKKSISQWIGFLFKTIKNLIHNTNTINNDYLFVKNTINSLYSSLKIENKNYTNDDDDNDTNEDNDLENNGTNQNEINNIDNRPLCFNVFKKAFIDDLSQQKSLNTFLNGGITFCSFVPMRSIPFKVIAMLGMNLDTFPRKHKAVSFSMLDTFKEKGDISIRNIDKHIFLETILCAEEYLYISYIGKDTKDSSIKLPSPLVDDLINYIQDASNLTNDDVKKILVQEHPLHNFSNKYNNSDNNLRFYLDNNHNNSEKLDLSKFINNNPITDNNDIKIIDIKDFLSFFKYPIKYYFNKNLNIYYDDKKFDESILPDSEIFELDNLEKWNVKNDITKNDKDDYYKRIKTSLPLKNYGEYLFEELKKELYNDEIKIEYKTLIINHLQIGDYILNGSFDYQTHNNNFLIYKFKEIKDKDLFNNYIMYLFFILNNKEITELKKLDKSGIIKNDKDILIENLSVAENILTEMIKIYIENKHKLYTFSSEYKKISQKPDYDIYGEKVQELDIFEDNIEKNRKEIVEKTGKFNPLFKFLDK